MFLSSIRSLGATACLEFLPSGVCVLRLSGVVAPSSMLDIMRQAEEITDGAASAWLVDYTRAIFAVGIGFVDEVVESLKVGDPWHRPLALVAPAEQQVMWSMHARHAAAHGLIRRCFQEFSQALGWVTWLAQEWPALELDHQAHLAAQNRSPGCTEPAQPCAARVM